MTTFESDLTSAREALEAARGELLAVVDALSDADLERGRRGGWPVARVLQHVTQSDWLYTGAMGYLNGRPAGSGMPHDGPGSTAEARAQLEASGAAFRSVFEGVTEDVFYAVRSVGHEEYSVLSLLENIAHHDGEHTAQIRVILAQSQPF